MPIYEYTCQSCGASFEELVRSKQAAHNVLCPQCGGKKVERRPSVFAARAAAARPASPESCGRQCQSGGTCPWAQ